MKITKSFSTIYGEEVYRIEVPTEMEFHYLLLGYSQFIEVKSELKFKDRQKIEIVKKIADTFYVYPVMVISTDEMKSLIFIGADYSLNINRIGEVLGMLTYSRRKEWLPEEHIVSYKENGRRVILNSVKGKDWKPEPADYNNDWAVVYFCVNEL